jgi:hypothetical protein
MITHVSISQKHSRHCSVDSVDNKSATKSNLRNSGEETPPQIKETNPKPCEVTLKDFEAWTVISKETVVLQPKAKHTVLVKVLGGNSRNPSCLLCVEPAHVPIEGISVARVLTRPSVEIHKNQPVEKSALSPCCTQLHMQAPAVPHDLKVSKRPDGTPETGYPPDWIMMLIANCREEQLTVPKGRISENLVVSVSDEENTDKGTEQTFFLEVTKKYLRF